MKVFLGFLLVALSYTSAGAAQPNYMINADGTTAPPPIDGHASAAIWKTGSHVSLEHEISFRKGVQGNGTDVYALADSKYLYLAFVCTQTVPVVAQQHTNDGSVASDDFVTVKLWPGGRDGIKYAFYVTPNGTHTENSDENSAFSPHWDSAGRVTATGYEVTLRIPFSAVHSTGSSEWLVQFARLVAQPGLQLVWAYDPQMEFPGDVHYAGTFAGLQQIAASSARRPLPRLQPYGLAEVASQRLGGATSRAGLDFSIPYGGSNAFYGTVHPDYSEVEADQQSISPTEFSRQYREVRPFFTQAASYYNSTGITDLYTPNIPTPRYGYAIEGKTRHWQYAGFNAIGNARDDNAQALAFTSTNHRVIVSAQRTAVNLPGFSDTTDSQSLVLTNDHNFSVYGVYGTDRGTAVLDAGRNKYRNVGANLYAPQKSLGFNLVSGDRYYAPADGYVSNADIHGYNAYAYRQWTASKGPLASVSLNLSIDRYHNAAGALNQTDQAVYLYIANHHQTGLTLSTGSNYLLLPAHGMVPFNQYGAYFYDGANSAREFGASYTAGHFLNGFVRNAHANVTLHLSPRLTANAGVFRTAYSGPGNDARQTLERFSLGWQYSKAGSLAAGVRIITGSPAWFNPIPSRRSSNITASLDHRFAHMHFYAVYGDPNSLNTAPSFIMKLVRFIGADEGS